MSSELSPQQLSAIFQAEVLPYLFDSRGNATGLPVAPPQFVSVGGQPGTGKGRVLEVLGQSIAGAITVNGDELRQFHPDYTRLMLEDHLRMPEVTAPASGAWVGMATAYLREHGISTVVETTLRNKDMLIREFESFRAAGFVTELRVVAVPLEVSRLGTVSRYMEQVKDFGSARWTPKWAHDEAAANVPGTVAALVRSGSVDRVVVQDRDTQIFYDAAANGDTAEPSQHAVAAVNQARDVKNMSPGQAQAWVTYALLALQDRVRLGETHPDLVETTVQITMRDAMAVVPQAYPGDPGAQQDQLARLASTVCQTPR